MINLESVSGGKAAAVVCEVAEMLLMNSKANIVFQLAHDLCHGQFSLCSVYKSRVIDQSASCMWLSTCC